MGRTMGLALAVGMAMLLIIGDVGAGGIGELAVGQPEWSFTGVAMGSGQLGSPFDLWLLANGRGEDSTTVDWNVTLPPTLRVVSGMTHGQGRPFRELMKSRLTVRATSAGVCTVRAAAKYVTQTGGTEEISWLMAIIVDGTRREEVNPLSTWREYRAGGRRFAYRGLRDEFLVPLGDQEPLAGTKRGGDRMPATLRAGRTELASPLKGPDGKPATYVTVAVAVDKYGAPTACRIVGSDRGALGQGPLMQVMELLPEWRFYPGRVDGQEVADLVYVTVSVPRTRE